ncbi:uncharacterized protein LOC144884175 [Branchiostoma floridae x Branchiostoma japonicum]
MPSSNFTMASTTVTPSKRQSTSDVFIPMSTTGSSTQSTSSPTKPITLDIKTLLTKAKTIPSPSSDKDISESSTFPPGSTTTPANIAPAQGNMDTDQKPMTLQSPTVTIMQPKTKYFMESIVKAIPATTPATYVRTGTEHKEATTLDNQTGVRHNKEHGSALHVHVPLSVQIVMIVVTVILSCLLVVIVILAANFCRKNNKNTTFTIRTDLPTVYYNKRSQDVTIGAPSQRADGVGGSGSTDDRSEVHSVEVHASVHEAADQVNTEDENSPLISRASGEHFEDASSPRVFPDIPITEVDLMKLARTIGPGWEDASIQVLGISRAELATCQANNQSNRNMQIFDMLSLWKQKLGKRATLQSLCQLLSQAEVEYRVENV